MVQLIMGISLIAIAAVLGFYGTQLARDGWTKLSSPPTATIETAATTRPYVVLADTELVTPVEPDKPVQVRFTLKNTGQTQATGSFTDFTYCFSTHPDQREFAYQPAEPVSFSLAPLEQWSGYFFPTFILSPEKLEALNAGKARLFFYARGEYRDANGKTYQLPFARIYHPEVAGRLAVSPDNVVFK
jgi:hypothetical protein